MRRTPARPARCAAVAAAAGLVVALGACSGTASVPQADVESTVRSTLADAGAEVSPVSCPENLEARVGATMTCSLTSDGVVGTVELEVTRVEGEDVEYDIAPLDATAVEQAAVEAAVSSQLAAQVGQAPDSVTCPGDLLAEVDEVMECELAVGPETLPVTLTVTAVEGGAVDYDIQVGQPGR